ncbi:Regulating synaptic membrane exocytosi protein 2 [Taenia crassiceps]|uniref:Regulating synaptic membrane exocytosi protein 2 n=1 Tax=Taenia crassiceps TaxID=6207 RepID=A0ABR4Q4Q6_9CEST
MQQSQSPPPSAVPAQSASQNIYKLDSGFHRPGSPDQIHPDLSHLTPEERRIIEDVINRQRQEELIDRSQTSLSIPVCQVVHRGSKVFQRLPILTDASPSPSSTSTTNTASASNAQLVNSIGGPIARAKDEFFGGVTRRGLEVERPLPSVHHNRTSGDLFGAVSNFFTRTGGGSGGCTDICEVCHVTKFTGNAGHNCVQCTLKTCVRCGGWFGTQSSWMCKNCFSNLSSPSAMTHGAKDPKSSLPLGLTSHGMESSSSPLTTTESSLNPRLMPKVGSTSTSATTTASTSSSISASNVAPVERSLSSYAGVASRTRLRETMKDNRSVSEEERVWSHYQPTPSSHTYLLHSHQSPQNYYQHPPVPSHSQPHQQRNPQRQHSYSSIPPRYMQQHSSHYPTAVTQHPYNAAQYRHSTGPPTDRAYRRTFGEAMWTHPVMPPPVRFERHAFRSTEGGGVEGGGVSTTSCGSAEDSPHGGFHAGYLRRSGGGQMDPGSVSEPCQSEAYSRGDYRKSFTAESRMYQRSVEIDRPSSSRSVFWSPSQDGESLIGQVYLRKCRASGEIGLLSSFGLKLVIGKRVPSDMVGTFVSSVKEGSVADVMGELQSGDEILEWNGHNLRGLHQEEVSEILALSRNTDEVWLTVQRVIDDYHEESDGATSASFSRQGEDAKLQAEEGEEYGDTPEPGDPDPHLQLKLRYDEEKQALIVSVLAARDLPPQLNTQTWLCNSFCQITILPETSKYEPRCTRVARNTNDPVWIHNFTFENFVINSKELEVAIFDYLQGRTAFIGEVLINLQVADLSGRAYWYPIPPAWDTPDQDLSSQVQSESGTFEADEWSGETSERGASQAPHRPISRGTGGRRHLRNISPRSVPSHLSASASAVADRQKRQPLSGQRTSRRMSRGPTQPAPQKSHAIDRGARFSLSEDDQSFLSDNSEASGFSSFSKLSLQSNRLRQRQHQRINASKMSSTRRRVSHSRADCRSPSHDLLAETGEEEEEEVEEAAATMDDGGKQSRRREERPLDDQPKSSSTEEKSVSSSTAAAASTTTGSGAGLTEPAITSTAAATKVTAATATPSAARKRRSSIGHRFSNVLGISKKNTATSGTDKKTKASFQRSEEVLPAYIQTNEKGTVSGGYKAPGVVAEGAGFGGIAASSIQSSGGGGLTGQAGHHSSGLQHTLAGISHSSTSIAGAAARKDQLALEMGEVHVGEFVEGLGPGQLVGRQVLGMPCLGEIQLSFFDRKGHLEVEVIRARGLQQKNASKPLPTPYVKLHLLEGKQSVEKMRTTAPARRTLDPLFQQQFSFSSSYKDKILQVSVWGEYGRMDKKVFLGMCEIVLDDLNLRSIVFGWYKLFGMIAATAQHHKQVRRHTSFGGTSTATTSSGTAQTSSSSGKRRVSKNRQPRGKS